VSISSYCIARISSDKLISYTRSIVEHRISTYPAGALEFNLQALHDDPIPQLEEQLVTLQSSGVGASGGETAELVVRLSTEKEKRERWAVRVSESR
jgi:ubiquitin carboxyl-terminal hydrolase L5